MVRSSVMLYCIFLFIYGYYGKIEHMIKSYIYVIENLNLEIIEKYKMHLITNTRFYFKYNR